MEKFLCSNTEHRFTYRKKFDDCCVRIWRNHLLSSKGPKDHQQQRIVEAERRHVIADIAIQTVPNATVRNSDQSHCHRCRETLESGYDIASIRSCGIFMPSRVKSAPSSPSFGTGVRPLYAHPRLTPVARRAGEWSPQTPVAPRRRRLNVIHDWSVRLGTSGSLIHPGEGCGRVSPGPPSAGLIWVDW
jgi:hypothetical protein